MVVKELLYYFERIDCSICAHLNLKFWGIESPSPSNGGLGGHFGKL